MAHYGATYFSPVSYQVRLLAQILPQWENLVEFPLSGIGTLPSDVVVIITGSYGKHEPVNCTNTTFRMGLQFDPAGTLGGALPTEDHRIDQNVSHVNLRASERRVTTFQWIVKLTGVTSSSRLRLVATHSRNGDPTASTSCSTRVQQVAAVFWNLTDLTSSRYIYGGGPQLAGTPIQLANPVDVTSVSFPWSSGSQKWLVWHGMQYTPTDFTTPPTCRLRHHKAGGLERTYWENLGGATARVQVGPTQSRQAQGAFSVIEVDSAGEYVVARAETRPVALVTNSGQLERLELFAIRFDDLDNAQHTELFDYPHPGTAWGFSQLQYDTVDEADQAGISVPAVRGADLVAMTATSPDPLDYQGRSSAHRSGWGVLTFNSPAQRSSTTEGYLYQTRWEGMVEVLVSAGPSIAESLYAEWKGFTNPLESPQYQLNARHLTLVVFAQAKDEVVVIPPKVPGPEIVVVPGKETLGLGSLSSFPIEPDDEVSESYEDDLTRLKTQKGYSLSWPRMVTPRRSLGLRWSGLTSAQSTTLLDYFEGLGSMACKWTDPELGTELPYIITSFTLESVDSNGFHTVKASVVEGVYFGA